jgi:peroxiredoxin
MKIRGVRTYILTSLLISIASINRAHAINPGDLAPGFSLLSAEKKSVSLSDFSGKVVYLDFWASWCATCRSTLPWMNELQNKFAGENFSVLAVNLDQNPEKAKRIIEELRIQFPILYDAEGKIAKLFQLPAMPTSFLINQKGELVATYLGFRNGDPEQIESSIRHLLMQGAN